MTSPINLSGRVAIVTGAGGGLGRAHALLLASRGAQVIVNDLGDAADAVVAEIRAAGGQARAAKCSVADAEAVQAMVVAVLAEFGRIDILINNAGILQLRRFARVSMAEFRRVVDVNLFGSAICAHAVWEAMCEQGHGRILMTTSEGALYSVPGAAGYATAKLAVVGLMNALAAEGEPHGIRVNSIAPGAGTRMTETMLSPEDYARMGPDSVVPAALYLVSEDAPTGAILAAGAGGFERVHIAHTVGVRMAGDELTPANVAARFAEISDRTNDSAPTSAHSAARAWDED